MNTQGSPWGLLEGWLSRRPSGLISWSLVLGTCLLSSGLQVNTDFYFQFSWPCPVATMECCYTLFSLVASLDFLNLLTLWNHKS